MLNFIMQIILLFYLLIFYSCEDYGNPIYEQIFGCTDLFSPSYNENANIDDGSCQYSFTFSNHINIIFNQSGCYDCHDGYDQFNLENYENYIIPGQPDLSSLYDRITREEEALGTMPPLGYNRVLDQDIQSINTWIIQGAP